MLFQSSAMILLLVLLALVFLGLLHRVLDRMRLTKRQALVILGLMLVGGFLPDVALGRGLAFNFGGALVPLGVSAYLLATADTGLEKARGLLAAAATALVVGGLETVLPAQPGAGRLDIDPLYLPPLAAGLTAYVLGRSRRAAFIGGVLGIVLLDAGVWARSVLLGASTGPVVLGGGGAFGATVVAGVFAVLLAELVGEVRERLGGGPARA
ncbi:MAG: DUF1614 domain-containing protein [Bacillota bacterium]